MSQFKIVLRNESGAPQNYFLINQVPTVSGGMSPQIWSCVYQTAEYTQPGGTAVFTMHKKYFGTVGTLKGSFAAGASLQVSQTVAVALGMLNEDGTVNSGTTLTMSVAGGIQPYYKTDQDRNSAYARCFAVETEPVFTVDAAKRGNFMVGLSASPDGYSALPMASFMPEPGCAYQIEPSDTYYVAFGSSHTLGSLTDVAKIGNKVAVDFTKLPTTVTIVHGPTGRLVVQTASNTVWK